MSRENQSKAEQSTINHPFLSCTARREDSHIERIYACGKWPGNKATTEEYY